MWKIQKLVSKGDYLYAVVPDHPNRTDNNYVLHHRVVMENYLNRLLAANEVVHHINENKKDNRIANLALLSKAEHTRQHSATGKSYVEICCPECKIVFSKPKNKTCYGKYNGLLTFCCKSCSARFFGKKSNFNLSLEQLTTIKQSSLIKEYKLHSPI